MGPEMLDLVAEQFKALSDPARLRLVQALRQGPRSVNELALATAMGQANVSRHLSLLHARGIVARSRDGVYVRYSLADDDVLRLCELVCGRLEQDLAARRRTVSGR